MNIHMRDSSSRNIIYFSGASTDPKKLKPGDLAFSTGEAAYHPGIPYLWFWDGARWRDANQAAE